MNNNVPGFIDTQQDKLTQQDKSLQQDKLTQQDNVILIDGIINPNIITYTEILNPSTFIYNNIFLIDILNSDILYPLNIKTDVLKSTENRKVFVSIIIDLYSYIIAICNYCIDKKINNNLINDIKNTYLEFKSKNWYLFHTNDNIQSYNEIILKINDKIKSIYDKSFIIDSLYVPYSLINNNINNLKSLNLNGSPDEINISKFIINMYQTIITISYYIINNNMDEVNLFNNLVDKNYYFLTSLISSEYQFLSNNLFLIDLYYKKEFFSIKKNNKLELIDNINLLINDRLKKLLSILPNNINNQLSINNTVILNSISLIENNYYINSNPENLNKNNYPLNELFYDIKNNLKNFIYVDKLIKNIDNNSLIISNIYKCILQLIIECEYMYLQIDEKKYVEGFGKKNINIENICKYFIFFFIVVVICCLIKKSYC